MGTLRLLVCASLVLGGCSTSGDAPPSPFVPEDPDAILTSVIHYFADSTEAPIAVADTSWRSYLIVGEGVNPDSMHTYFAFGDSALLATYFHGVRSGYPLPLPDRDDVFRSPDSPRSQPIDYDALPDGRFLALMRPAVAADGSEAVLEYVFNCNAVFRGNCGHGGILFLNFRDGAWVVVEDQDTWIT